MTNVEGVYIEPLGCYLLVERTGHLVKRISFSMMTPDMNSDLAGQIAEHLINGSPCQIDLDLSLLSTFQKEVFQVVSTIPRGKTITYGEVAKLIKKPRAARAVGRALGANPFAVIIPCHRVLSKDGLGGYRWGIDMKKVLLAIEAARF